MSAVVSCGLLKRPDPPPPTIKYVPVQPPICLRLQPPHRPAPPSCQLDRQPCADEYTAALLDYLLRLESWSALAWTSCKGSQP